MTGTFGTVRSERFLSGFHCEGMDPEDGVGGPLRSHIAKPFYCSYGNVQKPCNLLAMSRGGITIGDNVQIAGNVQLLSNNHDPYDRQILTCKPIVIKDGAWIGAGATILSGVTIGKFAIVGAASVVTHDVGDYEVAVGSPAKVIKTLDREKIL